jgi:type II secretory pathway pseudopilin PulG
MTHTFCHPLPSQSRRGATLVAVLAAMAVVLIMLGGMLKIALLGRRQFLKELELRQAECLLEAAAERAVSRLRADPGWTGGQTTVASEAIVGNGAANVTTSVTPSDDGVRLGLVVEYPTGRPDSVRRERVIRMAREAFMPNELPALPPSTVPEPSPAVTPEALP